MPFAISMRRRHLNNTTFCVFLKCVMLQRENSMPKNFPGTVVKLPTKHSLVVNLYDYLVGPKKYV